MDGGFERGEGFAAWFSGASFGEKKDRYRRLPDTLRKSFGETLLGIEHPASALNAFEVVGCDLVGMGQVPLGTVLCHGVVLVAQQLHDGGDDVVLQIGTRAAVSHVEGLGKEGKFDEAATAAGEWGAWIDGLSGPSKTRPVIENRESVRLKSAEVFCDAGMYDKTERALQEVVVENLSPTQQMTVSSIRQRLRINSGGVDGSGGPRIQDVKTALAQLEALRGMMGTLKGMVPQELLDNIDRLCEKLRGAEALTPELAADLAEALAPFRKFGIG